jgi:hypothetical protein
MKGWIGCAFIVATVSLAAQAGQPAKLAIASDADYSTTMKDVQAQNGALAKALTSAAEADVIAAAGKLETDFKNVQAYWEAKKVDDATTFAKNAVAAAQAISKAATAHDMAAANAALPQLRGTCGGCHMAHRAGTPGNFTIK